MSIESNLRDPPATSPPVLGCPEGWGGGRFWDFPVCVLEEGGRKQAPRIQQRCKCTLGRQHERKTNPEPAYLQCPFGCGPTAWSFPPGHTPLSSAHHHHCLSHPMGCSGTSLLRDRFSKARTFKGLFITHSWFSMHGNPCRTQAYSSILNTT